MPLLLPKIKKNKHDLKRKFLITPILIATLVFANTVIGISSNFIAGAANFSMKTGYYMGTGSVKAISGIGFKPDMIIIAPDSGAQGVYKTSAMPANFTSYFSATAPNTSTVITLNNDGFSLSNSTLVNTSSTRYTYTVFAGSDCTSSGTFCVGSYTGNGNTSRLINTGFQPTMSMVTRNNNTAASFKTKDMASNIGQYFTTTSQATTLFPAALSSNGFTVGTINNNSSGTYYYAAFKEVDGIMKTGTYTGNGSNRSIAGFGAGSTPSLVLVKNSNSNTTASRNPIINQRHYYGDFSSSISSTTASIAGAITSLVDNGFQVGTNARANQNGRIIYWAAWGGEAEPPSGEGSFKMATGVYTGNGTNNRQITDVGFQPDVVLIKRDNNAGLAIAKTSLMAANTSFSPAGTASYTDAITELTATGFSLGTNALANASGGEYHWQAFGGAYSPDTNSGSEDFIIGAYTGNGIDSRQILSPLNLDLVTINSASTAGSWRTSANSGDQTNYFTATAAAANLIQGISSNNFEIGNAGGVNTLNTVYYWFGFKNGINFKVGSYTGNSSSQNIYSPGFQPDLVWIKRTTSQAGVLKPSTLEGNGVQMFPATANTANAFDKFVINGFRLNSNAAVTNASGGIYHYSAWRIPTSGVLSVNIVDSNDAEVSSPAVSMNPSPASFSCATATGTLGTSGQRIRVSNSTLNPNWSLNIAPTNGVNSLWASINDNNFYDFNDTGGVPNGCIDGIDGDSYAGLLSINPTIATASPIEGCSAGGGTFGPSASFSESINSIALFNASNAQTNCYWDLTDFGISQTIPAGTNIGEYNLNLTITVTAN